jgi:6,7-dimethyl-8-ribityllumazine synthase
MSTSRANVAILAAYFNKHVLDDMLARAKDALTKAGASVASETKVPGCFEIPLAAEKLIADKHIDALVVLGYIEKGETLHGEVMGHVVYDHLIKLQLQYKKPIGMGIIGPGATLEQAMVRKESCALSAVQAALRMLEVIKE